MMLPCWTINSAYTHSSYSWRVEPNYRPASLRYYCRSQEVGMPLSAFDLSVAGRVRYVVCENLSAVASSVICALAEAAPYRQAEKVLLLLGPKE